MKRIRTPLSYYGGKTKLAEWIVGHMPPHVCYVEPYGGGAAVLFCKPPSPVEIYNDINSGVVAFFRCLRSCPDELISRVSLTPYSREEWKRAREIYLNPDSHSELDLAWATVVVFIQSMGCCGDSWSYARSLRRCVEKWSEWPARLQAAVGRLKQVQIEHDDALAVLDRYDSSDTLFYLDPPYVQSVRVNKYTYLHEAKLSHHVALIKKIKGLKGMVLLSGYHNELYDEELKDWASVERETLAVSHVGVRGIKGSLRVEVLWLNPNAVERKQKGGLL